MSSNPAKECTYKNNLAKRRCRKTALVVVLWTIQTEKSDNLIIRMARKRDDKASQPFLLERDKGDEERKDEGIVGTSSKKKTTKAGDVNML
ncbi:hypothetical protein V6N13_021485 [Hibiscus sabdariffa]|uniref:Uncharacterized protein n=1 Tax=Hibiscus sabdariffa TaxID=183260 RepID=A0ABR2NPT4_9ROSI